jgi:hypothetical protein
MNTAFVVALIIGTFLLFSYAGFYLFTHERRKCTVCYKPVWVKRIHLGTDPSHPEKTRYRATGTCNPCRLKYSQEYCE